MDIKEDPVDAEVEMDMVTQVMVVKEQQTKDTMVGLEVAHTVYPVVVAVAAAEMEATHTEAKVVMEDMVENQQYLVQL
tara:strand:+ start:73 stop:306 length:234 start_codon:yes stop_codon:yes gene_type:complete